MGSHWFTFFRKARSNSKVSIFNYNMSTDVRKEGGCSTTFNERFRLQFISRLVLIPAVPVFRPFFSPLGWREAQIFYKNPTNQLRRQRRTERLREYHARLYQTINYALWYAHFFTAVNFGD